MFFLKNRLLWKQIIYLHHLYYERVFYHIECKTSFMSTIVLLPE